MFFDNNNLSLSKGWHGSDGSSDVRSETCRRWEAPAAILFVVPDLHFSAQQHPCWRLCYSEYDCLLNVEILGIIAALLPPLLRGGRRFPYVQAREILLLDSEYSISTLSSRTNHPLERVRARL